MEELYLEDCYINEFDAIVESVIDERYVVLDRTAFYPEAGGQPYDTGFLYCAGKGYPVVSVRKADGRILHEVGTSELNEGDAVRGVINWDRRYLLMRYHTACHILSAIIHNETGAKISGNQLSEDKTRVDFSLEEFDREQLKAYEAKVNDVIDKKVPLSIEMMDREEAFKIPSIVKLKDAFPPEVLYIRVITIAGIDRQACGGTHVVSTGEIPHIEVFKAENKGKNNRRIYFRFRE
ncbi:alanyl-tRNA editing protein AlaXM [Methanomethylovorans sp.]|uniref:alanyl-tRNA editing protein AlaXM n=1 Tax=Methanomethylovorans sp. TaxID=2758717 RepID=UPI00351C06A2